MTEPQQPAATTAGQVSPDGQYIWNGSTWAPNPDAPRPKKKHTLRNILIAVIAVIVLMVGGCMALLAGAVNEVDKAIDKNENQEGGSNNPITLDEGEGFTIGDIDYLEGWSLKQDVLGNAEVVGLKVTNNAKDADFPSVEFRLWNGSEELAEISCGLLKEVQPGSTAKIECSGDQPLPKSFDKLTVQNSY